MAEYVRRAAVVGITWPVSAELDGATLEVRLFSLPFVVHEPHQVLCEAGAGLDISVAFAPRRTVELLSSILTFTG